MMRVLAVAAAVWSTGIAAASAAPEPAPTSTLKLERVVVVMRHGVRPPTVANDKLDPLSAQPWPTWPVAPGILTDHGEATVKMVAFGLHAHYLGQHVLPAGCPAAGEVSVWADGADQRTRKSGEAMAETLAPNCGLTAAHGPEGQPDMMFASDRSATCSVDADEARRAMIAQAGGEVDTPAVRTALARLQSIVAPDACHGGPGKCFDGTDAIVAGKNGARIEGPLSSASTLVEDLMLEYEEGFEDAKVGWGRAASPEVLAQIAPAHERATELTRQVPYVAARRGAAMARAILDDLDGKSSKPGAGPVYGPQTKMLAFAGHDTNLSNMGAIFGLKWSLPGQPNSTAPATALVFELYRDADGERYVRTRVFFATLAQLRDLKPVHISAPFVQFDGCANGPMNSCKLSDLRQKVTAILPKTCGFPE